MVTFRNNNNVRRNNFRRNERSFKSNGERSKFGSNFSKNENLISEKKQNIKLMKAELAYLSRPERLQSIAKQQFNMKEILPSDIWNINDISKLYFEKN